MNGPILTPSQRRVLFTLHEEGARPSPVSGPAVRMLIRQGWLTVLGDPTEKAARLFRDRAEAQQEGEARAMLHRVREAQDRHES